MKKIKLKIFSLFGILFMSFALLACGENSPEKVAEKFISAIYKGDIDTSISLMHIPEEIKSIGNDKQIRGKLLMMSGQIQKEVDKRGGVKSIKIESVDYSADKNQATVKFKTTFKKDNTEESDKVKLIKENGTWKVSP